MRGGVEEDKGDGVRKGWEMKRLGEVCDFQRGLTYAKGDEVESSHNVVLRANNIDLTTNTLDLTELRYIGDSITVPAWKKVRKDSLMICTASGSKSHLGKVAYVDNDYGYAFGGFMGLITPKRGLLPRYLFHLMTSDAYRGFISALSDGANINNLKFDDLGRFPVPCPDLPDQRRIVGILDEAFAGIAAAKATAERNRDNARAIFENQVESVFAQRGRGWNEKPLSSLCEVQHGFAFKSQFFSDSGDYVLLTPGSFHESGGYRDRGTKQKYYSGAVPKGFVLAKGDLLVAMTEQAAGLLGSAILVPESNKFLHNQRLGLVVARAGVPWTNRFFFHVFNTRAVRKAIHDSASGVKVRHTSPTKIGETIVRFPTSVLEQERIVADLAGLRAATRRLESLYAGKVAGLEELRRSVLHEAFRGGL